jgi:hypothetical protein
LRLCLSPSIGFSPGSCLCLSPSIGFSPGLRFPFRSLIGFNSGSYFHLGLLRLFLKRVCRLRGAQHRLTTHRIAEAQMHSIVRQRQLQLFAVEPVLRLTFPRYVGRLLDAELSDVSNSCGFVSFR